MDGILIRFWKLDGGGGDNISQCMLRQEGEKTNEKGGFVRVSKSVMNEMYRGSKLSVQSSN